MLLTMVMLLKSTEISPAPPGEAPSDTRARGSSSPHSRLKRGPSSKTAQLGNEVKLNTLSLPARILVNTFKAMPLI